MRRVLPLRELQCSKAREPALETMTSPVPPRMKRKERAVLKDQLADIYRAYIACLNSRDWPRLSAFVTEDARHNGRHLVASHSD